MPLISARKTYSFKSNEIKYLLINSKIVNRSSFMDIRVAVTSKDFGRILIITPKKMGTAPKRNLIKRRIKSIFYENKLFLHKYNVIIFCKKEILNLSFNELKNYLIFQIKNIKI